MVRGLAFAPQQARSLLGIMQPYHQDQHLPDCQLPVRKQSRWAVAAHWKRWGSRLDKRSVLAPELGRLRAQPLGCKLPEKSRPAAEARPNYDA